jgi:aspartate ammonia-lyase
MTELTGLVYRIERDSMGERQISADAYYGIQTLRAMENFPISGIKPLPTYVDACVLIKKATGDRKWSTRLYSPRHQPRHCPSR